MKPYVRPGVCDRAVFLAATSAALLSWAWPAWACGGCFSPPSPEVAQTVVQDAERVLFLRDDKTKQSTVHVEVRYSGLAQSFGWVLPLPKLPVVSVGTRRVFDVLDTQLGRKYQITWDPAENCVNANTGCASFDYSSAADCWSGVSDTVLSADAQAGSGGGPGSVEVLSSGSTGPYDFTVVKGNDATLLQKWLSDHGYATPAKAVPIIASHIAKGDVFVAIKLSNGQGVQAIRPIVLTMDDAEPCVPLRLTAIAAASELTVSVTLAGPARAVVKNHLEVEVNPLRLTWATPPSWGSQPPNYAQVAAAAIDEASGHAFITEASVPGASLTDGKVSTVGLAAVKNLYELGEWMTSQPAADDELGDALAGPAQLEKVFPGKTPPLALAWLRVCAVYWQMPNSPSCVIPGGPTLTQAQLQVVSVDGPAAAGAIQKQINEPLAAAFALVQASPRVTRLLTRVSPEEMDRDPVFAWNPALPTVPAIAPGPTLNTVCTTGWSNGPTATRLSIDGLGSWVVPSVGIIDPLFKTAPAAIWKGLVDETGLPQAVADADIGLVDAAIAGAKPGVPSLPKGLVLKAVKAWVPPPSDPLVTTVGKWYAPDCCVAKPGWKSGELPPPPGWQPPDAGTTDSVQVDAVQAETTGPSDSAGQIPDSAGVPDAAGPEGGPVPGIDAAGGWKEVAVAPVDDVVQEAGPGAVAATKSVVKADSGCRAGRDGDGLGAGWMVLAGAVLVVLQGRRWRRASSAGF